MSLNNRYQPSHPAGQSIVYGLDFSNILPPGVSIEVAGSGIEVEYNTVPPTPATDLTVAGFGPPLGRRMYATISGGSAGSDYRLTWSATDSLGNVWLRSTLLLCAATS